MLNYLYSLLWPSSPPHRLGWSMCYGEASVELQEASGMELGKVLSLHHKGLLEVVKLSKSRFGVPSLN